MTVISVSSDFVCRSSSTLPLSARQIVNKDAFLRRMERLDARRSDSRAGAIKLPPRHLDAELLRDREMLDAAWHYEVTAMIVAKKLSTSEADAIVKSARAATEAIVARIEATPAKTLDGLKVKARAVLWRRDGEPLQPETFDDELSDDEPAAIPAFQDQ